MSVNLIIAGVGGQGSVLASRIIADAALEEASRSSGVPVRVRVGETFGAAMRGGAVSSHVRIGEVYSPLVGAGAADLIMALEPLEGLRIGANYLKSGGFVVMNTVAVPPTDVKTGMATYPSIAVICDNLRAIGGIVLSLDATALAIQAGTVRSMNVVMVGASFATGQLPVSRESLVSAIKARVPSRYLDVNLGAFELGYQEGSRLLGQMRVKQ